MQEVSEKYNNDSYRERHALSVERLRTLPFEESVEDSYIAYFRLVALFLLDLSHVFFIILIPFSAFHLNPHIFHFKQKQGNQSEIRDIRIFHRFLKRQT